MSDLRGYLCWDPETAATTINTEAINPSPAVFLATHAPLRIRHARIQGRSLVPMDTTVDEKAVLKDFLGRKPDTGTLLMPVVGDSGSGKSHLVRWVRENIPISDRYRVIYLEKSRTSLKAVVHALLQGAESDALGKLKADIDSFSTGLDETGLARRLINALNEALAGTTSKDMSGQTRVLAGPKGLASILQDPYIQEQMLAPGKYIPQLASQLLHNRAANSPERPPGFAVEDLPLNVRDIKQAAQISQRVLRKLLSIPELQTDAVDLLNQYLETAVRSASNLGSGRLLEAILQVREEYAKRNKEIILLVEDFALIQGVQRELLEALTEAATREGKLRYAPMRTLMAVTTGYFKDLPETVMSRVSAATTGYVYDLDVIFSPEDNGTDHIASFVGRYLNAARVGHEELERFNGRHVPNRCDTCPVKTQCHDSFGHTEEGYGLYPFNKSALVRTVHSVAPADNEWSFVPRTVLGTVVRPVLVEYSAEIAKSSFPHSHFKERFRTAPNDQALTTAVAELVNTHDQIDPERRKQVLEFWGDAPSDPFDLDPGILQAFGLQPLSEEARQHGRSRSTGTDTRSTRSSSRTPDNSLTESLKRKIRVIENWAARDQPLQQGIANELRGMIIDTVIRRYKWSSSLMKELGKGEMINAWPTKSTVVSIEGAGGENLPGTDKAPIKFKRNAMNSQFFQSLLLAERGADGARAEDIRRLAGFGETKAKDLTAALERYFEISDADLTVGFRASLMGAALAGKAWPGMDDTELLAAALDEGRTWKRGDHNLRTAKWQQVMERHLQYRGALVDRIRAAMGISQGIGAVRMIDAARALPLLRQAAADWTWSTARPVPAWVKDAVIGFASWDGYVDEQLRKLATILERLRQSLPRGVVGRDTVEAVRLALKESEKVGLSPGIDERARLDALIAHAATVEWRVVSTLEDDLDKISATDEVEGAASRVRAAARDRGESLEIIHEFLVAADYWLTSALSDAAARSDSAGDAATLETQSVLSEWASLSDLEGEGNG